MPSGRDFSGLSENHNIFVIGVSKLKLWGSFKGAGETRVKVYINLSMGCLKSNVRTHTNKTAQATSYTTHAQLMQRMLLCHNRL